MLGQIVNVTIDNHISAVMSFGHVSGFLNPLFCKNVYIMLAKNNCRNPISAAIVAIANNDILVVAPVGHVYYAPEISYQLTKFANISVCSLVCLYEKSCGAVVFHPEYKVMLIKNLNGSHWTFPKGHIEFGESEQETAIREVREETGLDIKILDHFRKAANYKLFNKIKKNVVFFAALALNLDVTIQENEIENFLWLNFQDAFNTLKYNNDIIILKSAIARFKTYNKYNKTQKK